MRIKNHISKTTKFLLASLSYATLSIALVGCGGTKYTPPAQLVQVGTATGVDANLPPEPTLPTDAQVCSTLYASDKLVTRPDGALPPEADPSTPGVGVAAPAATVNPDQARIQAALDACGAAVDAEVGATIATADAAAVTQQKADQVAAGNAYKNISGASAEELAKPQYIASKFAVKLAVSNTGLGNAFISGPLTLPSGVTLWIDKGVTLFASRDVMLYNLTGKYCGNTAVSASSAGSSGNCNALITGTNLVNSAVLGDGAIDSRGYAEIVTSNPLYPLMKVDLTCSNTYVNFAAGTQAAQGTSCDNGGSFVDLKSSARNMTWWDLAYLGNMIENGTTGAGSQSVFRMMVFNYAKNLTLYRITLNNSANFHVVPSGVDGFIVWGVKLQTPSLAAYQNPAGNGNPLYNGFIFTAGASPTSPGGPSIEGNVKNTDAFDPGSASKLTSVQLTTGSTTKSVAKIAFDGYMKNNFFAYNFISTGDDDIAIKGSNAPVPAGSGLAGVDGDRDVNSKLTHGIVIAHNHIYAGHGISIGSETNVGVRNVHVYDNSFSNGEEGLRIKSDQARGGEVMNIYYSNICMRNVGNSLLFTPYYSIKAGTGKIPNFHDITVSNMYVSGVTNAKLQGFMAGTSNPQYPLTLTLNNVVMEQPENVGIIDSDANLTLTGLVNLPLLTDPSKRVVVTGKTQEFLDPALVSSTVVDCTQAYTDFPALNSPTGTSWPLPKQY
jgi:polygalacturonase